jgi:hypothetical protein
MLIESFLKVGSCACKFGGPWVRITSSFSEVTGRDRRLMMMFRAAVYHVYEVAKITRLVGPSYRSTNKNKCKCCGKFAYRFSLCRRSTLKPAQ